MSHFALFSCIIDVDMDIVYICRDGDNEELRYSIRSAVKNLPHDNVWVVGGKPEWYVGNYIMVDQGKSKYSNARKNLTAICNEETISESFILMNDDFYIINKVKSVPYMYSGTLDDKIQQRENVFSGNSYTSLLRQTLSALSRRQKTPVLDYELHVPMVFEKKKLSKILKFAVLWRSVYGNLFDVGGIKVQDVKIYEKGNKFFNKPPDLNNLQSDYLSSNDDSFDTLKHFLNSKFSRKSKHELKDK
jgi:hypothetical protein